MMSFTPKELKLMFSMSLETRKEVSTTLRSQGVDKAVKLLLDSEWETGATLPAFTYASILKVLESRRDFSKAYLSGDYAIMKKLLDSTLPKVDYQTSPAFERDFAVFRRLSSKELVSLETLLMNSPVIRDVATFLRANIPIAFGKFTTEKLSDILRRYKLQVIDSGLSNVPDAMNLKPFGQWARELDTKVILDELIDIAKGQRERVIYSYNVDSRNLRTQQMEQASNNLRGDSKTASYLPNVLQSDSYQKELKAYSTLLKQISDLQFELGVAKRSSKEIDVTSNITNTVEEKALRKSLKNKQELRSAAAKALKLLGNN